MLLICLIVSVATTCNDDNDDDCSSEIIITVGTVSGVVITAACNYTNWVLLQVRTGVCT